MLSSQASLSRSRALLKAPRLYAVWMHSILGDRGAVESPPGVDSLPPMSLAPLWVSMARSGHTADPSGPTHQYMLGSLCDMPAIKA